MAYTKTEESYGLSGQGDYNHQ